MKRQRGRGRKPGHHNSANRTYESSGPEVKVRGSASHVYEKYLQLARDAHSSGDRVMAENYLQHAEHYYRILRALQPQQVRPEGDHRMPGEYDGDQYDDDDSVEGDGEGAESSERQERDRPERAERSERSERHDRHERQERGDRGDRGERPDRERRDRGPPRERVVAARTEEPEDAEAPEGENAEAADGNGVRRNRRRRRFRPGEGRGEGPREAAEGDRPVEGFGDQLPAFVTGQ